VVQQLGEEEIILEVGGVGLRVSVPHAVLDSGVSIGHVLFLHTYMVVRESSLSLYGFDTTEQREIFELLMQVGGVGPRLALAVLSHLSPDMIRSAVANDHPEVLVAVPGIGRKTAQKVIFHLKEKLKAPEEEVRLLSGLDQEVLGVLSALGYNQIEAHAALQMIPADTPEEVEERVKFALKYFAEP
jgi:Holliday junction DNA helicase RuvA